MLRADKFLAGFLYAYGKGFERRLPSPQTDSWLDCITFFKKESGLDVYTMIQYM